MRNGYTTGTCAQAAAKGACVMLMTRRMIDKVGVRTLSGARLNLGLTDQKIGRAFAECAVIKDSGDEIDATNGAKIFAKVRLSGKKGVSIKGSKGIGKVTKPGLAVAVGEWAINPTPRKKILEEVSRFLPNDKGLEVTISAPDGKKLASRTYNPRLGIVGGISIIGTTGIVKPKSLDAFKKSLALELDVLKAEGHDKAVLVLGYVGERFCKGEINIRNERPRIIKIGDHVGFMLKECAARSIKRVLLIGHIGKLIKVANGQLDTNFRFGDNRISSIMRYAKQCGAGAKIIKEIRKETTAEAAAMILKRSALGRAFEMISKDVSREAQDFVNNKIKVKCILLSLEGKVLGRS